MKVKKSKDDLIITGGKISVTAQDQGLYGQDCVKIKDGTFALNTQGDAIQSDNAEDATKGFVYVADGSFTIETQGDAFQAETLLQTDGGTFNLTTGGGSENGITHTDRDRGGWAPMGVPRSDESPSTGAPTALTASTEDETASAKGFKAISTGDDGLHADSDLKITGGTLVIAKSYEGLEENTITLTGGIIDVTASDDGVNVAGGNDGSSLGRLGQNNFDANQSEKYLKISGGDITVNASGDGLDYNGTATITGGVFLSTGSSGMAQGFATESTQSSLLYNLTTTVSAGRKVTLTDSNGKEILNWTAKKDFSSIQLSSPDLVQGSNYT
ncbi:MAG: carbohydrate-binding domain-containing protein [Desulfitobacterium sp.]